MSKIDEIRSEMVAAMKAGDKERKAALSFLLSSLKNKAIDKRADLTEEEEGQVILKEIKQLKETLEMTLQTAPISSKKLRSVSAFWKNMHQR